MERMWLWRQVVVADVEGVIPACGLERSGVSA